MRVAIVGFGRIGHVHAAAWRRLVGVDLVAAADAVEVESLDLDVVIVATPTWTHADVVRDLRRRWPGRIVVEKPAATTEADVDELLDDAGVEPLYHAAYAPEVEWAAAELPRWTEEHGELRGISMAFADPYAADLERATSTLGDSWLDGGINAVSVLTRLVEPERRVDLRAIDGPCSTFEAAIAYVDGAGRPQGVAQVVTSWAAIEPSKSTRLDFADGAVAVLDHQAVLGRVASADGRIVEAFSSASADPRLVQHYVGSFTRLLIDGERSFPVEVDRLLHRLVLSPDGGGRTPPRSTDDRGRRS